MDFWPYKAVISLLVAIKIDLRTRTVTEAVNAIPLLYVRESECLDLRVYRSIYSQV